MEQEIIRAQEQIKTLFNTQERLEEEQHKHEAEDKATFAEIVKEIKSIRSDYANRLPVWATFLFATLTAAVAWFARG